MSENSVKTWEEQRANYWVHILGLIFIGALLWLIMGAWAGYGLIYDIHEWGMYWFVATVFVGPVVLIVALLIAAKMPDYAIDRGSEHPYRMAKIVLFSWFVIALLLTAAAFLVWAESCC